MKKAVLIAIDNVRKAQQASRSANDELKKVLSKDVMNMRLKKDVKGLEILMDKLPECLFRYTLFQDIEKLKLENDS